jgi:hypothetical protein
MKDTLDEVAAIKKLLDRGWEVGYTEEDGDEYRIEDTEVVGGFYSGSFSSTQEAAEKLYTRRYRHDGE